MLDGLLILYVKAVAMDSVHVIVLQCHCVYYKGYQYEHPIILHICPLLELIHLSAQTVLIKTVCLINVFLCMQPKSLQYNQLKQPIYFNSDIFINIYS